ncbi:MAG TPA: glycosyltransferase family 4 protein [Bryobacteraceae bacterium]|nr:glycosyltransferase family 4 protein [Bryobacteraceae bacterium]
MQHLLAHLAETFNSDFNTNLAFPQRTDVIPLCVNTDALVPREKAPLRKKLGLPKDAIVLLYLGYVSAMKADLIPLLSILRNLVADNSKASVLLVIAGTGRELSFKALIDRSRALGVQKNVVIRRGITDENKTLLLAAADIFVSPSDSIQESFGLTPIEAMSCGVPQIVSDWDGYRDTVVDGETGFLVPTIWADCKAEYEGTGDVLGWEFDHISLGQSIAMDPGAMRDRLHELIRNPELRALMSRQSRMRAVEHFGYKAVAGQYDALFAELMAIANTIPCPATPRRFDQPAYFRIYGHYATRGLGNEDHIAVAESTPRDATPTIPMWSADLDDGLRVLDSALAAALVETARKHSSGQPPALRVGHLIELATRNGHHPIQC